MTIGAAIVLFAVVWFMVLFVVLPLRLTSQEEAGEVVPGTSPSAPENPQLKKKALVVTLVSIVVWGAMVAVIVTGVLPLETFDFYSGIAK